jgi:hypothetical protein
MKQFFIVLTLLVFSVCSKAQSAEDSVKAVVNNLFTAMIKSDTVLLKTCFADSMVLQTIVRGKSGGAEVKSETAAGFVKSIGSLKPGSADEQITFGNILIDGPLALVWTPYKFYFNGQFSHCGVNSFHLVRFKEGWRIQYLIDTRRRTGCEN